MQKIKNQSGFAGILEVLLVAVALVVVGFTVYHVTHKNSAASVAIPAPVPAPAPAAGTPAAVVQVVEDDAINEATDASELDSSSTDVTATDSSASNLDGSYNENSF